ncbi:RNA-binding motif protein, X-linked 2 isoform X2 [Etheostoma spectabile]|uniref:RNA-binding motif protein, X-linked 2 isoform X2 n=1 Tax=Etheostoma spectabile TaxID=54343 RepID=UPI0013AF92C2|nr:RNA-binding motif protein, X-linked 2 isoform X2 [Etheostoma spectabile]
MNPLTKVKLINELNAREASLGVKESVSWHSEYRDSAWVFVGGFPYELTEGDVICVFSQYGEIVNINLVRDKKTGKSKGFCFICFEDQRSTVLAVDNLNGIKIKGRTIRVDHVKDYRPPKDTEDMDDITRRLREDGCAPRAEESSSSPHPPLHQAAVRVKEEKEDAAYDKYNQRRAPSGGGQNGQRGREGDRDRETDREGDRDRETDRDREGDKDKNYDRKREFDRDRDRRRETDRDGDRRRETDRDGDKRRETDRDRSRDREEYGRRNREREGDGRRETSRDYERKRDSDRRRETDREGEWRRQTDRRERQ